MNLRIRFVGALLVACGLALCYGAVELWPTAVMDSPTGSSTAFNVLRVVGAGVAAVFGVGNVLTGLTVMLLRTARE